MATDLRNLPAFLADDATFRTWASGLEAQLLACGLVQTADTGQIADLAAVARPAANAYAGYRVYRFNDDLHNSGGKKVFLKIEYGTGAAQDRPALRMQIATNTNGAGVLTGSVLPSGTTVAAAGGSKIAGQTLPSYCSGDGSGVRLCSNLDATSASFRLGFTIERGRNADGTGAGLGVFMHIYGAALSHGVLPFSGSPPNTAGSTGTLPILSSSTSAQAPQSGAEVALYPAFAVIGRPLPLLGLVGYELSTIAELVPINSASWLGGSHTFMPLGDGGPLGPGSQQGHAILWE